MSFIHCIFIIYYYLMLKIYLVSIKLVVVGQVLVPLKRYGVN
jgi:hypothetical protein